MSSKTTLITTYTCERCGTHLDMISHSGSKPTIFNEWSILTSRARNGKYPLVKYEIDLCDMCTASFRGWMHYDQPESPVRPETP